MNIHFTESDWQRIARDWNAWWAGELERPLVVLEIADPVPGVDYSQFSKFGLETPIDDILDNWQRVLEATHWLGDSFPKWWVNYGPGAMAAFLGSRVSWSPDTTWFWPLEGISSLREIHLRYDPANVWWQRIYQMTARAVERWGAQVLVGTTDIGGGLDILAALRSSEKLLLDVMDDPDEVDRLTKEITSLWIRYYDELEALTSAAGRGNACWGPLLVTGQGLYVAVRFLLHDLA